MIDLNTASHILRIPKSTLRYWEAEGLIASERSNNNYRHYHERDLIGIGDVATYRKLGVGVHEIAAMRQMSVERMEAFLDESDAKLAQRITELEHTRSLIRARRAMLTECRQLATPEPVTLTAKQLGIGGVAAFDLFDERMLANWIDSPYTKQYCLFFENTHTWPPQDGWIANEQITAKPTNSKIANLLWNPIPNSTRFVKMLLTCREQDISHNNLEPCLQRSEQLAKATGNSLGRMVARYLLNVYDEQAHEELACYELLVELVHSA